MRFKITFCFDKYHTIDGLIKQINKNKQTNATQLCQSFIYSLANEIKLEKIFIQQILLSIVQFLSMRLLHLKFITLATTRNTHMSVNL